MILGHNTVEEFLNCVERDDKGRVVLSDDDVRALVKGFQDLIAGWKESAEQGCGICLVRRECSEENRASCQGPVISSTVLP